MLHLLTIEIGIDPEIREIGNLLLTWHGVFTAVGIAAGVFLAVVVARRLAIIDDDVYSGALIAIPFGIVGARALFVWERWNDFSDDWVDIFRINEGGISIYGAVIGGLLGALIYAWFRKIPLRRAMDVGACGALLGMAVGRIGDIINGEHFAQVSDLPWAVKYTNINSPSVAAHPDCNLLAAQLNPDAICAQHPAVAYEMLGDLAILGLLLLVLRRVARDGVVVYGAILLYSIMRFLVSSLRIDSNEIWLGMSTPQVTALILIPIGAVGLLYSLRDAKAARAALAASAAPGPPAPAPAAR